MADQARRVSHHWQRVCVPTPGNVHVTQALQFTRMPARACVMTYNLRSRYGQQKSGVAPIYAAKNFTGEWHLVGDTTLPSGECPSFFPLPQMYPGTTTGKDELPTHVHKRGHGSPGCNGDCMTLGTWEDGAPGEVGTWKQVSLILTTLTILTYSSESSRTCNVDTDSGGVSTQAVILNQSPADGLGYRLTDCDGVIADHSPRCSLITEATMLRKTSMISRTTGASTGAGRRSLVTFPLASLSHLSHSSHSSQIPLIPLSSVSFQAAHSPWRARSPTTPCSSS